MQDVRALNELVAKESAFVDDLLAEIGKVVVGQSYMIERILIGLLTGGHVLLEGVPGLAKTLTVRTTCDAIHAKFARVQFTPDLLPADLIGTVIYNQRTGDFTSKLGPIFANLVLADEINRATPRTQSALLEAMQEGQVTAFGETRVLEAPFCVVATQNPIEMEGTYPLPEAQLDRFLCKLVLRTPAERDLIAVLDSTTRPKAPSRRAVLSARDVLEMRALVREVPISSELLVRVARLVQATDPASALAAETLRPLVRYGSSPRGGQALVLLAKARALLDGRPWVVEEDLAALCAPALRHRLVLSYEGEASGVEADALIAEAWNRARS